MAKLSGKHVVVTGASAGIGAELCRQLGAQGCKVTLASRREARLEAVAAEVRAAGGQAQAAACDVTRRVDVFTLAQRARQAFGEIDVWVSNAGAGIRHRVLEATEADMLAQYHLNCLSSLWAYQAVIPRWLDDGRGGHVIDVSSLGGKAGFAYAGGYAAAKHAQSGLGDALRQELAGSGVHVTTVYPGPTVSDFSSVILDRTDTVAAADIARLKGRHSLLMRRTIEPQPTAVVVRAILRCIQRPKPTVYPHRWGNFAVLAGNLLPALALSLFARARR